MSDLLVLPLRAVLIGDRLPFDRVVVDKITDETTWPKQIEVIFSDGETVEGTENTLLTIEDVACTLFSDVAPR